MDEKDINVRELADAIAAALSAQAGETWTGAKGNWGRNRDAIVNGPDEKSLHLHTNYYSNCGPDRVAFSGRFGDYDKHIPYGMRNDCRGITVSATKTPEQIARDVARRLLPSYTEVLAAAKTSKAESDAAEEKRDKLIAEMVTAFGGASRIPEHDPDHVHLGRWGDQVHGSFKIMFDDVKFEMRVPRESAVAVAAFLGGLQAKRQD